MLIQSLNTRGLREGELRDKILAEKELIEGRLKKCKVDQYVVSEEDQEEITKRELQKVENRRNKQSKNTGADPLPMGTGLHEMIELSLRDQILLPAQLGVWDHGERLGLGLVLAEVLGPHRAQLQVLLALDEEVTLPGVHLVEEARVEAAGQHLLLQTLELL